MTKTGNSADLINNLLLNLDNLIINKENNDLENIKEVGNSIQDQLESLKNETEKITSQYTQNNIKSKSKKIPPPIITGKYRKRSQFQTIDDMLLELNNASIQTYGGNKTPKSGKGRKIPDSFIDPRRYSDPYKYTILSTLDETEGGEEEEDNLNNPQTPKTSIPYYSRKKEYKNINGGYMIQYSSPNTPRGLRNRSYSQPERYSSATKNILSSSQFESSLYSMKPNSGKTSMEYLNRIKNSVNNEKMNKNSDVLVKPPRTSSMSNYGNYKKTMNKTEEYSGSDISDSDQSLEPNYYSYNSGEVHLSEKKGYLALENKSSFHSDITLVNEE
ncbi:hypothetical protein BCR36DRAFT_581553 [Piromyces finnis]|uniref:Uncharacterized protein n=1 Tax=Piromyces finnis TaxID=1754191 RepID=A0A1Y1VFX4_9FUNG|nr:hypothetical protein BCR36DRAFT_581553 [Piromyces finnis]|eukprot:ORX54672.1 hypothetical protein BCR36DRAFT_581553 [Piromyces finnis]